APRPPSSTRFPYTTLFRSRGDVDDAAEAAAHHRVGQLAGQTEDGAQIDVDYRVPVIVRHPDEQAVAGDSRVVDENIDALELSLRSEEHTSELQSREKLVCR